MTSRADYHDPRAWSDAEVLELVDAGLSEHAAARRLGCRRARVRAAKDRRARGEPPLAADPDLKAARLKGAPPALDPAARGGAEAGSDYATNQAALARVFDVDRSTVTRWKQIGEPSSRDPFPEKGARGYNVAQVRAWVSRNIDPDQRRYHRRKGEPGSADAAAGAATAGGEPESVRDELKREQVRKLKLENDLKEGRLVDAEEVRRGLAARMRTLDSALRAMVQKSHRLVGCSEDDARAVLEDLAGDVRAAFTDRPLLSGGGGNPPEREAA